MRAAAQQAIPHSRFGLRDRLRLAAKPIAAPTSLSAPIYGWNTRDALPAMNPLDAVTLDNFYPDNTGVSLRKGYTTYANIAQGASFSSGFSTGFQTATITPAPVKTLAEYSAGAIKKFLAATGGVITDISSPSSPSALGSGFTSDQWQTINFLSRLFFVNGSDTMQVFDGTTLAAGAFTGVTLSTLIGVSMYQQRLFFWQNNSTGFWYAQLNSISGALAFYDLAAFAPRGGNLIATITFSHDGGAGVLDYVVFVMSKGECLVYFGNDPSNAANWALVGRYRISPPVSPRAVCNYGAEAFLTTYDDHVPLSQQITALKEGRIPPRSKISGAVQAAVTANISATGWQALYYPQGRRLIFNIPNTDGSFSQHIQNTGLSYMDNATGKAASPWCRFVNMKAYCWGLYNDNLYFGSDNGVVYQADIGNLDNLGVVSGTAQQSWNTLKSPRRKSMKAVRPLLQAIGTTSASFGVGFDYGSINVNNAIALAASGSPWDSSAWDTSPWSTDSFITTSWRGSGGTGTAISLLLSVAAPQPLSWLRSDLRIEQGMGL